MSHEEGAKHIHEFGNLENVVHIDTTFVPRFVQKPTIHQYIENGKIHRSKVHRAVGQFELFLDLVMVGVVHLMAENAAEDFTGLAVARFVLTFWGAWSIWSDYRNYANTCGMDDLPQRIYIFVVMGLLIGYTANATGFLIEDGHFENKHVDFVSLKTCVAFLLVAKLIRFILFVFYGWYHPMHLMDQWSHAGVILVAAALYLGSMFSPTINTGAVLFGTAAIVENLSIFLGSMFGSIMVRNRERRSKRAARENREPNHATSGWKYARRFAIINIEHAAERNGGVYIIVLGESITSLLYTVYEYPEAAGINPFYGRAVMVLMVSYCLNWMYFTPDYYVKKTHPIRRHWLTANLYTFLHWPLCSGLVFSSAGVVHLVRDRSTLPGARWYWGGGTSVAVGCLLVLDFLPKWDFWTKWRIMVFTVRCVIRLAFTVACALLPLIRYQSIDNLQFLGIYASLFVFVMAEELVGKAIIMAEARKLDKKRKEMEQKYPELKHKAGKHKGHHKHAQSSMSTGIPMVPDAPMGGDPASEANASGSKFGITEEHSKSLSSSNEHRHRADSISEISVELNNTH